MNLRAKCAAEIIRSFSFAVLRASKDRDVLERRELRRFDQGSKFLHLKNRKLRER